MLARLTRLGIACDAPPAQLRSAREHFEQHNYLRLPGFVESRLLRLIQRHLRSAGFEERTHSVGRELTLSDRPLANVFHVLMNDPKLFRLIRQVTGCGRIGCFTGRLYQMVARQGQDFHWHNDLLDDRKVAISVNLSDAPYRGGTLQIRDTSSRAREVVPNLGFGDAIIFRVAGHLVHRVTPVTGKFPKTALTGWFRARPRHTSVHQDLIARSEAAIASQAIRRQRSLAMPSRDDVAKIPPDVVSQSSGRETFVASIGRSMCYGLNETGVRIWQLKAQGHAMRSISAARAREYEAPRREVERDVLALAYQLAQRDLVKVVRATNSRRVREAVMA